MQSAHNFQMPSLNTLPHCEPLSVEGEALRDLLRTHKVSDEEYKTILEILGRSPTFAELGVFSAMWSEHCSYKSSRIHLKRLPTEGPQVVVGPGENAGIVRLSGKLCAAFKMESHNHPSYIEPYQGAATGVGGILRDVFCMGARPVANLNCLRFGLPSHPRTHYLVEHVVKGIGDYGNCVGIPTVAGNISFNETYNGNCLVNAMTVGVIHEDRIFKGYASGAGNLVIYVGSATGRDGIHGATMASDSFDTNDSAERATVQVGDPFAEKLLLEVTLELLERNLVVGLQDMGAAGLTSSSFEMADRAGSGLYLDLDRVPTRAQNMSAYELLLSESQERMLLVVEPEKWPEIQNCLEKWELAFSIIGQVTDSGRVQIAHHQTIEVDMPVGPLAGKAPVYDRPRATRNLKKLADNELTAVIKQKLAEQSTVQLASQLLRWSGSKKPVFRQYDHHIGAKTILGPEQQGAGLLWLRSEWADPNDTHLGLAVSASCNERVCGADPFTGGALAVLKSARSIAATGAKPLAVTDCLNFGNPEDPPIMEQFAQAIDGIAQACQELETPVVSGNVSLYNTTDGTSILPTPMIGMVGRHPDVRCAVPAIFQNEAKIGLLAPKNLKLSFGASLISSHFGLDPMTHHVPAINWQAEKQSIELLQLMAREGFMVAARDVGEGGLLSTLLKMCLGGTRGAQLNLTKVATKLGINRQSLLWAEGGPLYVLGVAKDFDWSSLQPLVAMQDELQLIELGETADEPCLHLDEEQVEFAAVTESYLASTTL